MHQERELSGSYVVCAVLGGIDVCVHCCLCRCCLCQGSSVSGVECCVCQVLSVSEFVFVRYCLHQERQLSVSGVVYGRCCLCQVLSMSRELLISGVLCAV